MNTIRSKVRISVQDVAPFVARHLINKNNTKICANVTRGLEVISDESVTEVNAITKTDWRDILDYLSNVSETKDTHNGNT